MTVKGRPLGRKKNTLLSKIQSKHQETLLYLIFFIILFDIPGKYNNHLQLKIYLIFFFISLFLPRVRQFTITLNTKHSALVQLNNNNAAGSET